jgi:hypothetical protein
MSSRGMRPLWRQIPPKIGDISAERWPKIDIHCAGICGRCKILGPPLLKVLFCASWTTQFSCRYAADTDSRCQLLAAHPELGQYLQRLGEQELRADAHDAYWQLFGERLGTAPFASPWPRRFSLSPLDMGRWDTCCDGQLLVNPTAER